MNTQKLALLAFLCSIVGLIVGFSACDRISQIVQPTTPRMTETGADISIGVVLPLTG